MSGPDAGPLQDAAVLCELLAPADCELDSRCFVLDGWRLDPDRGCYESLPAGCHPNAVPCGGAITNATDATGDCWQFPSTCQPPNLTPTDSQDPACGYAHFEDVERCPLPGDAGSVPGDAGGRGHNGFGNSGLDECLAPDGNIEPTRVCSPSPTDWIRVDNSGDRSDCHGASDAGSSCLLPWGCGAYDEALASVLASCEIQTLTFHTVGSGWGYRVIQSNSVGAFFSWAFYDGAGNLVGAYSSTDTGPELCAGTVPNGLYHTDQLSNAVDPCEAGDAGR